MLDFFGDLLRQTLATPALLVGFFTFLGLLLQKTEWTAILQGSIKAILGFVILQCGAEVLARSLGTFGNLFDQAFGLQGVVPNNEAVVSLLLQKYGMPISMVMFLGMFFNLLLARLTPMKYIFLTGHHTLFMAALLVLILQTGEFTPWQVILWGAFLLGLLQTSFPALIQWGMRKITGSNDFALGHFGTLGYCLAALVGKLVGKNSRSTEAITFPKAFLFFRETSISIVVTMFPLFVIVSSIVWRHGGLESWKTITGSEQNILLFCLMQSILFAAGIFIVLQGVRLILGEILPAFKGISDRLVPEAKPALDCPLVFPYAPNAVILGFLSSFLGGLAGLLLCGWFHWTLILPGVIPHFFCGATAGVFGNATGGIRGCLVGAFAHGILITLLPLLVLSCVSIEGMPTTFGDTDFNIVGAILYRITNHQPPTIINYQFYHVAFFLSEKTSNAGIATGSWRLWRSDSPGDTTVAGEWKHYGSLYHGY
ncbi:MAG: PTS ascorbate transporter subunit IIC [Planctomycetia bacterium]|nr:PTS ascorbate transporter subunit IIC [Planctomycetia bacterium]